MNNAHEQSLKDLRLTLKRAPAPEQLQVISLEKWRVLFYRLGLIGEYPNKKIGYGTLSTRHQVSGLLINGAQTGHLSNLQAHHYTRVTEADLKKSSLIAEGLIPPPRDALAHSQLYDQLSGVKCIFQIHSKSIWKMLKRNEKVEYRRNDLSNIDSVTKIINQEIKTKQVSTLLCSEGDWGVLSIGPSVDEVGKNILNQYRALRFHQ